MIEYFLQLCYYKINNTRREIKMNKNEKNIFNVATFFLNIVDRDFGSAITPLKLQKILYYAQGYYLAMFDEPLFNEDFQAWAHGPVNPEIYEKYKEYGFDSIDAPDISEIPNFDEKTVDFLCKIWATFGIFDGKYLEELTHKESPWLNAREGYKSGEVCHEVITKESMKEFFKTKLNEH